jgi:toxin ParE1/3/4
VAKALKLVWTRPALRQLSEAREYIAIDDPAAANRQIEKIEQTVNRLMAFPMIGRAGIQPGTREFPVPGTPYIIVYRVLDERLRILAVLHGARMRRDESID